MSEPICPKCGAECCYDEVDIGVGIQRGPEWCPECYWSALGEAEDRQTLPGYYVAPDGAAYKIDAIVERAEHLGLDGSKVREAFDV